LAYPQLPYFLTELRSDFRFGRLPVFVTLSPDPDKAGLPELDVRVERLLKSQPTMKVDEKTLIRIVIGYDGLNVNVDNLDDWLKEMHHDYANVRITQEATLTVRLALDKIKEEPPELRQRIKEITLDLLDVTVQQESPTRINFILDGMKPAPAQLEPRLERLQRDFKDLRISRELPARIIITSAVPLTLPPGAERKANKIVQGFPNIQVGGRPLSPEAVQEGMSKFISMDPLTRPLSAAERKDQQLRAIEGLRRMATGIVEGYDVRPAAAEIRAALKSDDLAPAAIETVGRLPGKEAQQDLANFVLDPARPVPFRVKAAEELVHHMQVHGSAALEDMQIQNLLHLLTDEKNADVKSAVSVVLGAIPRDRLLKNLPDDMAKNEWVRRLQNYKPDLTPAAPPAPAPAPAPKDENPPKKDI
jgi:hypothetical protein